MTAIEARTTPHATLLSTDEVVAYAGCTLRQIDHWVRLGVVVPTEPARGSGSRRRYSHADARLVWLITQLQSARPGSSKADVEPLADIIRELRTVTWQGRLVLSASGFALAQHAADLLDGMHSLGPAVTVVDLDRCPDPAQWEPDP